MNQKELLEVCGFLSDTPNKIRLMVESLTAEEQRSKPTEGGFSVLENICHLRDIEEKGYRNRIERILSEENPFLPDIDGDKLALEREYQKQNLFTELSVFSANRAESLSLIRKSSSEDLERTGVLENVGQITLSKLLLIMSEHDREHLQSLSDLCRNINNPSCR
jgi:hypothetical protein